MTPVGAGPAQPVSQLQPASMPDSDISLIHSALGPARADNAREALMTGVSWRTSSFQMFGRRIKSPRLIAWEGDHAYTYSRVTWPPAPWGATLRAIRDRVEELAGASFNGVLLNLYRDGRDSMGWHSDDEAELGSEPTIASLSLGGPRRFLLRHKGRKDLAPVEVPLNHGTLVVMRGPTQAHWQHQVPKTKRPVAARINLTFRRIIGKGSKACRPV